MSFITVYNSPLELAEGAADLFIQTAKQSIASRGRFMAALAGGSTPEKSYILLSKPDRSAQIDWKRTFLFFGDERFLPLDNPDSNYNMANNALLSHVPIPDSQIFPVNTSLSSVQAAALDYDKTLQRIFQTQLDSNPPRFDLILLGLGDDGHIASLFPGSPSLQERARRVVSSPPGRLPPPVDRVTFTYPVLNNARQVVFLAAGARKAEILHTVLDELPGYLSAPASGVIPDGSLTWLLDKEAAANIQLIRRNI